MSELNAIDIFNLEYVCRLPDGVREDYISQLPNSDYEYLNDILGIFHHMRIEALENIYKDVIV